MKAGKINKYRNKQIKLISWRRGVWMVWRLLFLTFTKIIIVKIILNSGNISLRGDCCEHTSLTWWILPLIQEEGPSRRSYFFPLATRSASKMRTDSCNKGKGALHQTLGKSVTTNEWQHRYRLISAELWLLTQILRAYCQYRERGNVQKKLQPVGVPLQDSQGSPSDRAPARGSSTPCLELGRWSQGIERAHCKG